MITEEVEAWISESVPNWIALTQEGGHQGRVARVTTPAPPGGGVIFVGRGPAVVFPTSTVGARGGTRQSRAGLPFCAYGIAV